MEDKLNASDLSFLKTFTDGDTGRMVKYINNFLSMAPEKIAALQSKLDEKNWDELRGAAHKLKPQLSYMGINSIKDDIQKIEDFAAEEKNLEQLPELVATVSSACQKAFKELNAFVRSVNQ